MVSVMFVFRREKLGLRDKKKRKKRVVTVGRYTVFMQINSGCLVPCFFHCRHSLVFLFETGGIGDLSTVSAVVGHCLVPLSLL